MSFEDRYTLQMPLGDTVRGSVWSARDATQDKLVAIAILSASASAQVRAEFQAIHLAAKLAAHPAMVRVFETGQTSDGRLYAAIELVEADQLRARLTHGPPLRLDQIVRAFIEVLEALEKLHDQDLAHGDISPGNILLREKGSRLSKRVIGLGLGRARIRAGEEPLDEEEQLLELAFMSPAQARGDVVADARSDTYSVAAVLYAAMTGYPPHYGTSADALRVDVMDEPVWSSARMRPELAGPVADALDQALGPAGFANAADFAGALRAALVRSPRLAKLDTPVGALALERGDTPADASEVPTGKTRRAAKPAFPKPAGALPPPALPKAAIPKPAMPVATIPKPSVAIPKPVAQLAASVAEPRRAPGVPEPMPEAFEAPTRPTVDKLADDASFEPKTKPSLVAQWPRADAPVGEIERLSDPFDDEPTSAPEPLDEAPPRGGVVDVGALITSATEEAAEVEEAEAPAEPEAEGEFLEDDAFEEWKPPSLSPAAFAMPAEAKRISVAPDALRPIPRAPEPPEPADLAEPIVLAGAGLPKWVWAIPVALVVLVGVGIAVAMSGGGDDTPPEPVVTLPPSEPEEDPDLVAVLAPDAGVAQVEVAMDLPDEDPDAEPAVLETEIPEPEADGVTRLRLSGVPAGAIVFLDGQRVPGPDLEIPPGRSSPLIEVRLPGHRTWRRRLLLSVPDELPVRMELEGAGRPAVTDPPEEPTGGGRSSTRRRRTRPTIVTDPGF